MTARLSLSAEVPQSLSGSRFDQIAASLFPDYSRGRLQTWIKEGCLRVNGKPMKSKDKLYAGDALSLEAELDDQASESSLAEPLPLNIVYEDEDLLIINKPAGTVVHPAAGNRSGTLMNGLLHYCPQLAGLPRAGIVHRLDKETTGLMVVAKTLQAHHKLVRQLQQRDVQREYEAVVNGVMTGGGMVDLPIGRHSVNRQKRAVREDGKEAITHYRLIARFRAHTHIKVKLETGRTHQIRVHMSHIRYPLVGDPLYGGRLQIPKACSAALAGQLKQFRRQALHARRLGFIHPGSGEDVVWEAELPADMQELLVTLRDDTD